MVAQRATAARIAVSAVFFLHGLVSGMWASRISAVQEHLQLGVGALGLALLGAGLGGVLALLPTGALIARHGSRTVAAWAALPAGAAFALLALAINGPTLFGALLLFGAGLGALDIAMNAQGAALEQRRGTPIMSSLHGLWSVGGMSGAAAGAFLAGLGMSVQVHFLAVAPLLVLALLLATRPFVAGDEVRGGNRSGGFAWPRGRLLALAAVVFCAVGTEGAMLDWGAVYLRRMLDASEGTAASAAAFFSAAMAVGRLGGDQITARLPAPAVARSCAAVAALGIGGIILAPIPAVVLGSLVAVGLGLALLVPLTFGAAGRSTDIPAGTAIAAVATVGYAAFLVGPPTIGLVAEHVTLRGAFVLLLALMAITAILAPAIAAQRADALADPVPAGAR